MELIGVYGEISNIVGREAAIRLAEYFSGQYVYFPTLASVKRNDRDDEIRRAFNGKNVRELARRFGLSEQRVRDVLKNGMVGNA